MTEERLLEALRRKIEACLGWGSSSQWTNADFHTLSERIADVTGTTLSHSTLKRVWGKVSYRSQPSTTTLDALASFAGYDSWRAYRAERQQSSPEVSKPITAETTVAAGPKRNLLLIPIGIGLLALLGLILVQSFSPAEPTGKTEALPPLNPDDYHLSFRPVTTGVPNSVVFEYTADQAPTEEVYLQQSWDPRRREKLDRNQHTHTSIYYLPGFYRAKLLVGDQVVQEREVLISSEDWVAAVDVEPVPVYLPLSSVRREGRLAVTETQLTELDIDLQPRPPRTTFVNVGQLDDLWSDDFTFRTRLRHDYATGAAACQHARVLLLLKNGAIIIPLSAPGCVADLELYAGGKTIDGRKTDLSAFGAVGDSWLELTCTGRNGLLTFGINGRQVLQLESEEEPKEIIGIRYEFSGMGSVDELRFGNGSGDVWIEQF